MANDRRTRNSSGGGGARTEKRPAVRDPRAEEDRPTGESQPAPVGPVPRNTLPGMSALRWRPEDGGSGQPAVGPAAPSQPDLQVPSLDGPTVPVPPMGGPPAAVSGRIGQPVGPMGPMTVPERVAPGLPVAAPPSMASMPSMTISGGGGPPPAEPEPEPRRAPGGRHFGSPAQTGQFPAQTGQFGEMVWKTQIGLPAGIVGAGQSPVGVAGAAGQTINDMRAVGDDSMAMSGMPRGQGPPAPVGPAGAGAGAGASGTRAPAPASVPPPVTTQVTVYKLERPVEFDRRLVMLREPDSQAAAAYRVLRYRLSERGNPRVIVVSSPRAKEGKTTCAVNLALALGECGRARVLLVEANLREPKLAEMLAFMPPQCFGEQVAAHRDQPEEPWTVVEAHSPWLHVAAVKPDQKDRPLIDAPAFAIAIDQLRHAGYDYVVIDTPPVLGTADVNLTQDSADGVLLVVKARFTAGRHLRRAIEQLAPSRVLGLVMADAGKSAG